MTTGPVHTPTIARVLAPGLTIGFATALAMWLVGYVGRLPGISAPPAGLAGALFAVMLAGGISAGRCVARRDAWKAGLCSGLVGAIVNLLVLGSVLVEPGDAPNTLRPDAGVVIGGWLFLGGVVGLLSGAIGARLAGDRADTPPPPLWLGRFAIVAAAGVLFLLALGGVVTSVGAGMAVPDWPNSYGANMFLYPLARMTGGIYFEHAHRLVGALVGLTTLALFAFTLVVERRGWVKGVAAGAFLFVCVQGLLGGKRVTLDARVLAFIHGVSGQLFFALMCALAAFLSITWRADLAGDVDSDARSQRRWSWGLWTLLVAQVVFGALVRHFQTNGAPHMHSLIAHIALSVVVFAMAIGVGMRTGHRHGGQPILRRLGKAMMHTVGLQMVLGVAALWAVLTYKASDPAIEVLLATGHQVIGAVLLAIATLAVAWSTRLLRDRPEMKAC